MTGRTSRIQKYTLFFFLLKIGTFWKNDDFVKNIFGNKLIFFHAILTFLIEALDAQQNFMLMR